MTHYSAVDSAWSHPTGRDAALGLVRLGRRGKLEDVAKVLVLHAREGASFFTGWLLGVNGGTTS